EYASTSFYNLFPPNRVVRGIGLFAETLVTANEFKYSLKDRPGIYEVFAEKENVDVVINSMGDIRDPHDLLGTFLFAAQQKKKEEYKINPQIERPLLEARGEIVEGTEQAPRSINDECVGNVQYRPYNSTKAIIEEDPELRSCTLYELADFTEMVRNGKPVVLIARQCGACGLSRARAVRPLLTVKELKVWSHIVMDVAT